MIKENKKALTSIVLLFLFVNGIALLFKSELNKWGIDSEVVIASNLLLFIIAIVSVLAQERSLKNGNPNAWIRTIMGFTFIKLIVLGTAALLYLSKAGAHKSKYAVFIAMALYLLYTWLEVRISLRMNKKSNAGN